MRRGDFFGGAMIAAMVVGLACFGEPLLARQAATPQSAQAQQATAPSVPKPIDPPAPFVPEGFTAIFNGRDLTGWHTSTTNHHGSTPAYRVMHGMIVATQNPLGQGGILLTDKKYKNVEVYMEVKPDYGCDSGLFLRSNEAGDAYQVTLDYLPGGGGGVVGAGAGAAPRAAAGALPRPPTPVSPSP